ncbi:MAG: hypothetical protein AAFY48_05370 [Bacteroidota bacterium]
MDQEDNLVESGEQSDNEGEEAFELDEYLQDYIDDDPSSYKLRADNYGPDEEDKQVHYHFAPRFLQDYPLDPPPLLRPG